MAAVRQRAPEKLKAVLQHLKMEPRPILPAFKTFTITYAAKNGTWGARRFAKEELPRIAYNNPELDIMVNRLTKKTPEQIIVSKIDITLKDGSQHTIATEEKQPGSILNDIWDLNNTHAQRLGVAPVAGKTPISRTKTNRS